MSAKTEHKMYKAEGDKKDQLTVTKQRILKEVLPFRAFTLSDNL